MPPENPFIKVRRQKEARESSGLSMDGALHAQLRRVLTPPLFTVKRLSKLRPKIQQIADELIDNMLAGPQAGRLRRILRSSAADAGDL